MNATAAAILSLKKIKNGSKDMKILDLNHEDARIKTLTKDRRGDEIISPLL